MLLLLLPATKFHNQLRTCTTVTSTCGNSLLIRDAWSVFAVRFLVRILCGRIDVIQLNTTTGILLIVPLCGVLFSTLQTMRCVLCLVRSIYQL